MVCITVVSRNKGKRKEEGFDVTNKEGGKERENV